MSIISEWWHDAEDAVNDAWEWVKDVFSDFTDLFVWSLNEFMWWFQDIFIYGVGLIIVGTIAATLGLLNWVWPTLTTIGGWITAGWSWVSAWAANLWLAWKTFADWLHLEELKKVHDIGQIVSPEYREAVQKVYGEIAKVSKNLGLGSGFMLLALSDARNLVLDTSSLFGHSYDIGEIEWVGNLGGYLEDFNEKAETFKNDPSALIIDIQNYFEPDIISARSGFQITILDFIGTTVEGLSETATKLVKLKDTLEQSILHLPEQISRPIYSRMYQEFDEFDEFMDNKFTPAINATNEIIDILSDESGSHTKQIGSIAGLLSNPGEVLANINALPEIERLRQEGQIAEISTRAFSTEATERNKSITEDQEETSRIAKALREERKPPSFLRLEYEGKPRPASIADGAFASWQVGDY